ncbi:MAG: hypothetical protein A2284_17970 [Deltaproteobacteria bacterium RIFOXYA12_FULL_61_11]|nr:MAG: hypothetical protein A2284_17970 [Deltaproteobacteria bacterium RIFOXYA12_FULL_61_11]
MRNLRFGLFSRFIVLPVLLVAFAALSLLTFLSLHARREYGKLADLSSMLYSNSMNKRDRQLAEIISGAVRTHVVEALSRRDRQDLAVRAVELRRLFPVLETLMVFAPDGTLLYRDSSADAAPPDRLPAGPGDQPELRYRDDLLEIVVPVHLGSNFIGSFLVVTSRREGLEFGRQIEEYLEQVVRQVDRQFIVDSSIVAGVILLLLGILGLLVKRTIIEPLQQLEQATRRLSADELAIDIVPRGSAEIRSLGQAFAVMVVRLGEYRRELEQHQQHLEELVQRRTEQLEQKNEQLDTALRDLRKTQVMLVRSEKMASLGQLVGGLAHELNNPVTFVYGNIEHLKEQFEHLLQLLELYERKDGEGVVCQKRAMDFDFLVADLPRVLDGIGSGAQRIKEIQARLRSFSRLDEAEVQECELCEGLDSALNLLEPMLGDRIEVRREYLDRPTTWCRPGQLNQVFMNVLLNAIQAIGQAGTIRVVTRKRSDSCCVIISDDGHGIPAAHLDRVFDPFFTTRAPGKGAGLGLSIAYAIIQEHRGNIELASEEGRGTSVTITLPIYSDETRVLPDEADTLFLPPRSGGSSTI